MDIRYIKKSAEKLSPDNIMSIINDFVMKTDLEVIQNYDPNKTYYKNDKVYLKYNDKHRVFICNTTTVTGEFDISKWRPFFKKETKITSNYSTCTCSMSVIIIHYLFSIDKIPENYNSMIKIRVIYKFEQVTDLLII